MSRYIDGPKFDRANLMRQAAGLAELTEEQFDDAEQREAALRQEAYQKDLERYIALQTAASPPSPFVQPALPQAPPRPKMPPPGPSKQDVLGDVVKAIDKRGLSSLEKKLQDSLLDSLRVEMLPADVKDALFIVRNALIGTVRRAIMDGAKATESQWFKTILGILQAWAASVPGGQDLRLDEEAKTIVELAMAAEQWAAEKAAADGDTTGEGYDPTIAVNMRRGAEPSLSSIILSMRSAAGIV